MSNKKTKSITVSIRFTEEHLAKIHEVLTNNNVEIDKLGTMVRMATIGYMGSADPGIFHREPSLESIHAIHGMRSKKPMKMNQNEEMVAIANNLARQNRVAIPMSRSGATDLIHNATDLTQSATDLASGANPDVEIDGKSEKTKLRELGHYRHAVVRLFPQDMQKKAEFLWANMVDNSGPSISEQFNNTDNVDIPVITAYLVQEFLAHDSTIVNESLKQQMKRIIAAFEMSEMSGEE